MYIQCFFTCCLLASMFTSLDTRHQNSCFHKAQIKFTGQGRNAPVHAPVGIHHYIIITSYKLSHIDFFVIFETLSVCSTVIVTFMFFLSFSSSYLLYHLASPPTIILHVLQVQPGELRTCKLDL